MTHSLKHTLHQHRHVPLVASLLIASVASSCASSASLAASDSSVASRIDSFIDSLHFDSVCAQSVSDSPSPSFDDGVASSDSLFDHVVSRSDDNPSGIKRMASTVLTRVATSTSQHAQKAHNRIRAVLRLPSQTVPSTGSEDETGALPLLAGDAPTAAQQAADLQRLQLERQSALIDSHAPKQIRLAFLPGGMSVSWTTRDPFAAPPSVLYSTDRLALQKAAAIVYDNHSDDAGIVDDASVKRSLTSNLKSTSYGTAWFHNVELHSLEPLVTYYYAVPHSARVFSFRSPPPPGVAPSRSVTGSDEMTILVNGDCGLDDGRDTIAAMLSRRREVDFFWHIGDISYADDWYLRPGEEYERIWNKWMHLMQPVTSSKPYMTLVSSCHVKL